MNIKLYNAAITKLRAEALESLALVELLLTDPTMVPDHSSLVDEISKHAQQLARCETAMLTLQQYFAPQPAPVQAAAPPTEPPAGPRPNTTSSISQKELLSRSPTMRKAMTAQKQKEERARKRKVAVAKKKEETNDD